MSLPKDPADKDEDSQGYGDRRKIPPFRQDTKAWFVIVVCACVEECHAEDCLSLVNCGPPQS